MNKLIILLLAVCLVSVHGFVKRDTPAGQEPDLLEPYKKIGNDITKKIQDTFSPENFQKTYDEIINTSKRVFGSFTKPEDPKN